MTLSRRDRVSLSLQRTLGWISFALVGSVIILLMRFAMRYRIRDLATVRRRFLEMYRASRGPLIICANHLTRIDSVVVVWGLVSSWRCLFHFELLPWSMSEWRNYSKNPVLRRLTYLLKCIPILRGAPPEETTRTLARFRYLLERREPLFIFPEGTRSHTGRVDTENFGYGVGRLLLGLDDARVLCVYARGDRQKERSVIPAWGDCIHFDLRMIQPRSEQRGLRAARDLSGQVISTLSAMEQEYLVGRTAG